MVIESVYLIAHVIETTSSTCNMAFLCGHLMHIYRLTSSFFFSVVRDRVIAFWFRDKLALAFGIAVSTMGLGSVLTFLFTSNMAQWIGLTETLFVGMLAISSSLNTISCLFSSRLFNQFNNHYFQCVVNEFALYTIHTVYHIASC